MGLRVPEPELQRRIKILNEYAESDLTLPELAEKHSIKFCTLDLWIDTNYRKKQPEKWKEIRDKRKQHLANKREKLAVQKRLQRPIKTYERVKALLLQYKTQKEIREETGLGFDIVSRYTARAVKEIPELVDYPRFQRVLSPSEYRYLHSYVLENPTKTGSQLVMHMAKYSGKNVTERVIYRYLKKHFKYEGKYGRKEILPCPY